MLVLLVVEWSDLVFAIDSIPAIFAITRDPFLVYSSNVFAILGLRALFFVLAGMMDKFVYLKPGVALILVFVGGKMAVSAWLHVPILASLAVIVLTLGASVGLSLWRSAGRRGRPPSGPALAVCPRGPRAARRSRRPSGPRPRWPPSRARGGRSPRPCPARDPTPSTEMKA